MKSTPTTTKYDTAFEEDVAKGLTSFPKYLLSKYIYDKKGDKLFQQIMNMPEYYLTNCELGIIEQHTASIADSFNGKNGFDLIELGAGDGKKTKVLLKHLVAKHYDFNYLPVDISQHVLDELEEALKTEIPGVKIRTQQGTYFKTLEKLADYNSRKKVIMVLGSNIGNLLHEKAIDFLKNICEAMSEEDMLFMGFDQKKNPQQILDAYNDPHGITEAFNKNLLVRMNNELDADFNIEDFKHWETYNPETGTASSYLVSSKQQQIKIDKLGLTIHFDAVTDEFSDSENCYKNYIFRRKTF